MTGISALAATEPLETWKDYLTFRAIEHVAGRPAQGLRRRSTSPSTARCSPARPRSARPLEARRRRHQRRARRGRRQALRRSTTSRRRRRRAPRRWCSNLIAAFGQRIDNLDWMAPATKAKAKAKLAVLKVGVGYPDRWRDYSGLEVVRGDAFGNAGARRALRAPAQPAQARPAGRPRRVGHDPADRQRRQPAGDERDELPRRHPAAALLRPQAARGRWTTAPSARSSATRSATASTTRAPCSTPRGGCTTGGPKEDLAHFQAAAAQARQRSTTPTAPSPTWRSTAS